jgi:hypothetical protein
VFRAGRLDRQTDTRRWTSLVFRAGRLDGWTTLDVTRVPRRWTPSTKVTGRHSCSAPVGLTDEAHPTLVVTRGPCRWTRSTEGRHWTSLVFRAGGLDRRSSPDAGCHSWSAPVGLTDEAHPTMEVTRGPRRWTRSTEGRHWTSPMFRAGGLDRRRSPDAGSHSCSAPVDSLDTRRSPDAGRHSCSAPVDSLDTRRTPDAGRHLCSAPHASTDGRHWT